MRDLERMKRFVVPVIVVAVAVLTGGSWATAKQAGDELPWALKQDILRPVGKWVGELAKEKNAEGQEYKKGTYSRNPRKIDEATYRISAHVNTAELDHQITERYTLTVSNTDGRWEVSNKDLVDTYVGQYRSTGVSCTPFEKMSFSREGLTVTGSGGTYCETYLQGEVSYFGVQADDFSYEYEPPPHAGLIQTGHDYYAIHELMSQDHSDQLSFRPAVVFFSCDAVSCNELIAEMFSGVQRVAPEQRDEVEFAEDATWPDWVNKQIRDTIKARKENPFVGFRAPDFPGHRWFNVLVRAAVDDSEGVWMAYDNWDSWEVQFGVTPKRFDVPGQLSGSVYGYFSEETIKNTDPYELERRDGLQERWFDVYSVSGDVKLGTDLPELLVGDVEFGLDLKQDIKELPFFIISFADRSAGTQSRPKPITVNTLEVDGEEVTWIQTGPISGRIVLPEAKPAGTRINVRMGWESNAILKITHSYNYVPRQGWMPFVSFGDVIDEFELTLHSPEEYEILGLGHKVEERTEDGARISHWKSDSPCNFPTIIFGRYLSGEAGFEAKKLDGTVVPIKVFVDKASAGTWDVRGSALKVIAEQAANSLNLYSAVSGLDYPFGELNLVNDPRGPLLYGQAPSSIIYLGTGVFRGEGALAPYFGDSTGIARFLRSVVAHEVGHQWWGNRIANANWRNYWFVESLAEYYSAVFLEAVYGFKDYSAKVEDWRRNIIKSNLTSNVQNASSLFAGRAGGPYGNPYQTAVYNKGPYAFHMLRETFKGPGPRGDQGADAKFFAFLKKFSEELDEKREIITMDIQLAAEKALGGVDENGNPYSVDLGWFFDQWIRGSGIPEYAFDYEVRAAEDGSYIIEGTVRQRVKLGQTDVELDKVYRGVVDVTVEAKGGPFVSRLVINEKETPVKLKVPAKPLEVVLNRDGGMLSHDVIYNRR